MTKRHRRVKTVYRLRVTSWQILATSGVLSKAAGAFFYDEDLKLVDKLTDQDVSSRLRDSRYNKPHAKIVARENQAVPHINHPIPELSTSTLHVPSSALSYSSKNSTADFAQSLSGTRALNR